MFAVAAALGTPLYVSTSLFVPIAHSLGRAGGGVGAIVALTISGAGANIPEFLVLAKLFSKAAVSLSAGYVFAVALAGGLLAQLLLGWEPPGPPESASRRKLKALPWAPCPNSSVGRAPHS